MTIAARHPFSPRSAPPSDGRQSPAAADIQRGTIRTLRAHGLAAVSELALANGRRADIVGISDKGEIWIVEIKSCVADFQSDRKWHTYREFCDRLWFAVGRDFPVEILPPDTGLILADRFGGEIVRESATEPIPAARRKSMMLRFGRTAADRLAVLADPDLVGRSDAARG